MKRRKPIDPRGHVEKPSTKLPWAVVCCENCQDERFRFDPWQRPCPAAVERKAAG